MTPEEKSLLERTNKLAEENNRMLRSMLRNARWSTVFRVAYWAIILFLSVGAYYAIQPYMNFMISSLHSIGNLTGNVDSANAAVESLKTLISK